MVSLCSLLSLKSFPKGSRLSHGSREARRLLAIEFHLVDAAISPLRSGLKGDSLTPVADGVILGGSTLPDAALSLDDPIHRGALDFLNNHPIGVIEAYRAAGLEVIHPEL